MFARLNACRQKDAARKQEEADARRQEAEAETARRAAYNAAVRREQERVASILAKQVPPLTPCDPNNTKHHCMGCRLFLAPMVCGAWGPTHRWGPVHLAQSPAVSAAKLGSRQRPIRKQLKVSGLHIGKAHDKSAVQQSCQGEQTRRLGAVMPGGSKDTVK